MKISKGVEWAAHACTLLAILPEGWTLSAEALAGYHDVPPAYMAKQMQALSRAELIVSQRGAVGGYRLAKTPGEISLWDIMEAIEGRGSAFRCTEIRQKGPCGAKASDCKKLCGIASAFLTAENAFRRVLSEITLIDSINDAAQESNPEKAARIVEWLSANATQSNPHS